MTLGLQESRLRQRRRRRLAIIRWAVVALVVVAVGIWAYLTGSARADREVRDLRAEIGRLTRANADLEQERDTLTAALDAAKQREQDWERRYARDVPAGEAKTIFALARQRLEAGVRPERLAFVLRTVENKESCDNRPDTKRFILPTPGYDGGNDSIGFADGTIRITGEGQAASDGRGGHYGWYDPEKPVTIRFAQLGGKRVSEVSGELPLHHSVVKGGSEYRFTIAPGGRGFVRVTGDRCDYP